MYDFATIVSRIVSIHSYIHMQGLKEGRKDSGIEYARMYTATIIQIPETTIPYFQSSSTSTYVQKSNSMYSKPYGSQTFYKCTVLRIFSGPSNF